MPRYNRRQYERPDYSQQPDNTRVNSQRVLPDPSLAAERLARIQARERNLRRSGVIPYRDIHQYFDDQRYENNRYDLEDARSKKIRDNQIAQTVAANQGTIWDTEQLDRNTRMINLANSQFTASQQVPAYMRYSNPGDVKRAIYGNSPLASGIQGAYNSTIGILTDPEYGAVATYDKIRDGKLDAWGAARNIGLNVLALSPFIGGLSLSGAKGAGNAISEAGNTATRALNNTATNVRNTISTLGNNARQMLYGSPEVQLALPGRGAMTVPISEAVPIARTAPISLEYPAINGITKTLGSIVSNAPYSVVANGLYNNARIMEFPVTNGTVASERSTIEQPQESQEQSIPEQQRNPEPEQNPTPEQPQESPKQPQQSPETYQITPQEQAMYDLIKDSTKRSDWIQFAEAFPNYDSPLFKIAIKKIGKSRFRRTPKVVEDYKAYLIQKNIPTSVSENTITEAVKKYPWYKGGNWGAQTPKEFVQNYLNPFHNGTLMKHLYLTVPETVIDSWLNRRGWASGPVTQYGNYIPAITETLFGGSESNFSPLGIYGLGSSSNTPATTDTTKTNTSEPTVTVEDQAQKEANDIKAYIDELNRKSQERTDSTMNSM